MHAKQKLPVVVELERIMAALNCGIYGDKIEIPPFVIQHDKKMIFRFVPGFYHTVIGAGVVAMPIMDMMEGLLHELVHIHNYVHGITDVTSNQYHNRRFQQSALEAGLYVDREIVRKGDKLVSVKGWCLTSLHPRKRFIEPSREALRRRNVCLKALRIDRQCVLDGKREIRQMIHERLPQRVCFLKYMCKCPEPHNSIRSGRRPDGPHPLRVRCEVCGAIFHCDGLQKD